MGVEKCLYSIDVLNLMFLFEWNTNPPTDFLLKNIWHVCVNYWNCLKIVLVCFHNALTGHYAFGSPKRNKITNTLFHGFLSKNILFTDC